VASDEVKMLCNELKRLKVVLRKFVQQLLDLEHTLRLILDVIGRDHRLVQFYEQQISLSMNE